MDDHARITTAQAAARLGQSHGKVNEFIRTHGIKTTKAESYGVGRFVNWRKLKAKWDQHHRRQLTKK